MMWIGLDRLNVLQRRVTTWRKRGEPLERDRDSQLHVTADRASGGPCIHRRIFFRDLVRDLVQDLVLALAPGIVAIQIEAGETRG